MTSLKRVLKDFEKTIGYTNSLISEIEQEKENLPRTIETKLKRNKNYQKLDSECALIVKSDLLKDYTDFYDLKIEKLNGNLIWLRILRESMLGRLDKIYF